MNLDGVQYSVCNFDEPSKNHDSCKSVMMESLSVKRIHSATICIVKISRSHFK